MAARLRTAFGPTLFTAAEAGKVLGVNRQKFQRWYQQANVEGTVEKVGAGAASLYRLKRIG
ncbi:MAG: hypothetical protein AB7G93_21740 [Bdellovibrionales bacterium]